MCVNDSSSTSNKNITDHVSLRRASTASTPPRTSCFALGCNESQASTPEQPPFPLSSDAFPEHVRENVLEYGATYFEVKSDGADEDSWRAVRPNGPPPSSEMYLVPPKDVLTSCKSALVELLEAVEEAGCSKAWIFVPKAVPDLKSILRVMSFVGFTLAEPKAAGIEDDSDFVCMCFDVES